MSAIEVDRHGNVRGKVRRRDSLRSDAGLSLIDSVGAPQNAREVYQREREAHLRSRPCVIDGCEELIPCPSHGEPAEDRGDWFRARGPS